MNAAKQEKIIREIIKPVSGQIRKVNLEVRGILDETKVLPANSLFSLRKNSERDIRHAILLLSSKITGKSSDDNGLIKLCAAAEIFYQATSIHDNLAENITKNLKDDTAGKKVLTGDLLETSGLLAISEILPEAVMLEVAKSVYKALQIKISDELGRAANKEITSERYEKLLESRSSIFIGIFSKLGAFMSNANDEEASIIEKCALSLGMAYQILYNREEFGKLGRSVDYRLLLMRLIDDARASVSQFGDNVYKQNIISLMDYFQNYRLEEGSMGA